MLSLLNKDFTDYYQQSYSESDMYNFIPFNLQNDFFNSLKDDFFERKKLKNTNYEQILVRDNYIQIKMLMYGKE